MIDSNQINAMMMQQQQQQQMLGMGAPSAVLGQSQYPPQYSFGHNGYWSGSLSGAGGAGAMMASGVGAAGKLLGAGATIAGILPASMVGSSLIGGAGALLGLNPVSVGLMGAAAGVGSVATAMNTGIRTNAQVGQMLSASNFANPNAPGGFGFSFGDQSRMTSTILGMGASNAFVGQQDQMQMLNQFQQLGLDKGVTSMGKMIDKFKEFSKTTEEVATQLGKTVSEVTGLVNNMRGSGFYSAQEVSGMSSRMSASAAYGMDMQMQQQLMQNMAQQTRGMGLSGQAGGLLGVNMSQALGSAAQLGVLNENTMMDITGTTNIADASQAMAQSVGGRFAAGLSNNGKLQNLLAGFSKIDSSGHIAIDESAISAMASGNMSISDLTARASDMSGGENRAKFRTNRKQLASDFLKSEAGIGAVLGTFKSMAAERSKGGDISEQEAFELLLEEYQIADERQAKLLYEMADNLDEVTGNNFKNRAEQLAAEKRRAYIAKHGSIKGMKTKLAHEVSKVTNNAYIAERTAKASSAFDSGVNFLEKAMFGVEDTTSGLYTTASTGEFRNAFLSGELNDLGAKYLSGGAGDQFKAELGARVGNLKDYKGFQSFLGAGMSDARRKELGGKLDTSSFEYHTSYANRDKDTFFTNATGYISDVFALGLGNRESALLRKLQGKSVFAMDDTRDFEDLVHQVKSRGKNVTDQEAYAIIAGQSDESAAALQRYLNRKGNFKQESASNLAQQDFLRQAAGGYGSLAEVGGFGMVTGVAGVLGLAASGAAVGAAGFGVGAIVGGAIGLGYGLMRYGDEKEFQAQLKNGGGNLLAKLNDKKKLRSFDERYKKAMLENGNDAEAAKLQVAKEMSEELGEAISAEDVSAGLKALYRASGEQDYKSRLESNDYSKALKLTNAASNYQKLEVAEGHLKSLRESILGEDVEGVDDLKAALSSSGENLIGNSQAAMLDVARRAISGEFTYEGDNEMLKQLAGAGGIAKDLESFEGRDIAALDAKYGEGAGAQLRKLAGVRQHGKLSKAELKEMAAKLAVSDTLRLAETGAKMGATNLDGVGDDEITVATKDLVNSTHKLAVYVDNIASVLTGRETAGQTIAGIVPIDKKEAKT